MRPHHHPGAARGRTRFVALIVVRIIRRQRVERRRLQAREAQRIRDVPDFIGRGMVRIARVVVVIDAVPDLEKLFAHHGREILGGHSPFVVRMVHMHHDLASGARGQFLHGGQVRVHHVAHRGAVAGLDELHEIRRVHVDRALVGGLVRDLFGLNEQKFPGRVEERPVFVEGLEPHFHAARFATRARFHPVRTESFQVVRVGIARHIRRTAPRLALRFCGDRRERHPALPLTEDIVIRESEEVVARVPIPLDDHLGKPVAVRPQCVGVEIALPPARFGDCARFGSPRTARKDQSEQQTAKAKVHVLYRAKAAWAHARPSRVTIPQTGARGHGFGNRCLKIDG